MRKNRDFPPAIFPQKFGTSVVSERNQLLLNDTNKTCFYGDICMSLLAGPREIKRWYGQVVDEYECSLNVLPDTLPEFSSHEFGVNEYLNVIVREPFGEDHRDIPVASVSKKYALIQHTAVADWLVEGIESAGIDTNSIQVIVSASEYGERVMFWVQLPAHMFDPGDGFDVQPVVEVTNSVDKTTALEVKMMWQRLICKNGMYGTKESSLRKIHNTTWMNSASVSEFIADQLDSIPSQTRKFKHWLSTSVDLIKIQGWVNQELSKWWGTDRAARFYSIVNTGMDGEIARNSQHLAPTEKHVSSVEQVPGMPIPVKNAYHALQALSWIAAREGSIENAQKMRRETVNIFESLLKII